MLLHRSPRGVILSTDSRTITVWAAEADRVVGREPLAAFREGALDAVIAEAFDVVTLAEVLAREIQRARGVEIRRSGSHAGRIAVNRTWTSGAGDPRMVWILGRTVCASNGVLDYEASFDVHLAHGFPTALADDMGPEVVEDVRAAVAILAPLPCLCDTGTNGPHHHDALETLVAKETPRGDRVVRATVARCTVCGAGWTFVWEGDERRGFSTTRPFFPFVTLDDGEVDRVVAGIRGGAEVIVGGSRCHTTYRAGEGGALVAEDFDEGQTDERPCAEATLRAVVVAHPDAFLPVLREPPLRRFREALVGPRANMHHARDRLPAVVAYGDPFSRVDLLEAVLAWPEVRPAPEAFEEATTGLTGLDLYHAVMSAIGYGAKSAAAGAFGLRFYSAIAAMRSAKPIPRFRRYRAAFREMTGDLRGALEDLVWEKEHQADDDSDAPYLAKALATLAARIVETEAAARAAPKRTFTLMLVRAKDPDALDEQSYAERRENGGGWTTTALYHPGDPDVLVRLALGVDMGVYGEAPGRDDGERCSVSTSCIFHADLAERAAMLEAHAKDPRALAARLVEYARSGEDPARVARAITDASDEPARGPAEEGASYVRMFLAEAPHAVRWHMGIAWEVRIYDP